MHLKPAPIAVIVHPVVGASKVPPHNVQVALVCTNNETGESSRKEAKKGLNKGDPYILTSAALLDERVVCELEVSGEGLFTHKEGITASLGTEGIPVTVQVSQLTLIHSITFMRDML